MKNQNQCASLTIRFHTSSSAEITLESGRQFLTILALQKIMILYIFFGIDDKVFPEEVLTDQVQDFFWQIINILSVFQTQAECLILKILSKLDLERGEFHMNWFSVESRVLFFLITKQSHCIASKQ